MASRLYLTTRPLFAHVLGVLIWLGIPAVSAPNTVLLVALAVRELILLDARQTQTRVTRFRPGRCHDALNRLLHLTPFSTRASM